MSKFNKISIILDEGPIARAYLNYFLINNSLSNKIIYLVKKSLFPDKLVLYFKFKKNYFYPLKYLKDKNIIYLIEQVEEFFNFKKNFINEMYNFNNIKKFKNFIFIKDRKINSNKLTSYILKAEDKFYLNTGKQILKEILDTKKKFIHIHPGYLPLVKGADGSLHSIDKFDFLGVSSFIMEKKIDHGKIIEREKLSLPYFKLKNFEKYKIADIYRIWFAFVDPLLRTYHLRNLVEKKIDIHNNQIYPNHTKENENYFTFMSNAELERTFKKIFLN